MNKKKIWKNLNHREYTVGCILFNFLQVEILLKDTLNFREAGDFLRQKLKFPVGLSKIFA